MRRKKNRFFSRIRKQISYKNRDKWSMNWFRISRSAKITPIINRI